MTVYVDDPVWPFHGGLWCHMWADSLDELHGFAKEIGLRRAWFQDHKRLPHYDLSESKRAKAIQNGAVYKSALSHAREVVRNIRSESQETLK